ncbi:hypothetical protein NDU88_004228 [Pleurodeles waltl]|uniref:Uncharacterized protein n=1 Tax=Pleurodeles waltl TaxID=8319 RepID=A0AAV7L0C8_PLEWA|nr:hypothetical protein NDU88_004228 [Pleurodeles waltl]
MSEYNSIYFSRRADHCRKRKRSLIQHGPGCSGLKGDQWLTAQSKKQGGRLQAPRHPAHHGRPVNHLYSGFLPSSTRPVQGLTSASRFSGSPQAHAGHARGGAARPTGAAPRNAKRASYDRRQLPGGRLLLPPRMLSTASPPGRQQPRCGPAEPGLAEQPGRERKARSRRELQPQPLEVRSVFWGSTSSRCRGSRPIGGANS